MIQDAIKFEEFSVARRRRVDSPAACRWQQFLRLVLLMAIGFILVSLTLNPSKVMSATSDIELRFNKA
jgi:hypothetical protein